MKAKLYLITLVVHFLVFETGLAQRPDWKWARMAGGSISEQGNSITTDALGNTYVAGKFVSPVLTFGSFTLNNNGITGHDMFIVKYDSSGNVVWAKSAGGVEFDYATGIVTDAKGNIYVSGSFSSPFITSLSVTNNSVNNFDAIIIKLDSAGNLKWAKNPIGVSLDWANSIAADSSGNCYVTGYFNSSTINFDNYTLTNAAVTQVEEFFIAKYDSSGQVSWAHSISGTDKEAGASLATDPGGNSYVTGYFKSPSLVVGTDTLLNHGNEDLFIAKYDAAGNVIWARSAGGVSDDRAISISIDSMGNSYVTGNFHSPKLIFEADTLTNSNNSYDVFVVKYDAMGNVMWARKAAGSNNDYAASVSAKVNGDCYITGNFESIALRFGTDSLINSSMAGGDDLFIAKYDSAGNVIWTKSTSGIGNEFATGIKTDEHDHVFVTGCFNFYTLTIGNDTLNYVANDDFLVAKIFECYTTDTTLNIAACSSYTSPSGNYVWNTSGIYIDTIPNSRGCDSVITVILTINNPTASVLTDTACGHYTSPSGNYTWSNSGTYTDTLTNAAGCDSIITINLTVNPLPVALFTLYPDTNTAHQWFALNQCSGIAPLTYLWNWGDSTAASTGGTPTHVYADSGYYSICVTVTDSNGCSGIYCDSSTYIYRTATNSMVTVSVVMQLSTAVDEVHENQGIRIYPVPARDLLNVSFHRNPATGMITITDLQGTKLKEQHFNQFNSNPWPIDVSGLSPGFYLLKINRHVLRFVKM